MNKITSILLCLLLPVSTAQANILTDFFAKPDITCTATDRACLINAAFDLEINQLSARKVKENYTHYAKRMAELLALIPRSERQVFMAKLPQEVEYTDKVKADIAHYLRTIEGYPDLTIKKLGQVIRREIPAPDEGYGTYIYSAFEQLLAGPEAQAAMDLWIQEHDNLWKKAFRSILAGHQWMVWNDLDRLADYQKKYYTPHGGIHNGTSAISVRAAAACAAGDPETGAMLLEMIENDIQAWKSDRSKKAIHMAAKMPGVIECDGEAAAFAHLDRVIAQMDKDIAAIKAENLEPQEEKFTTDIIRSVIAEHSSEPLALWLLGQGREEEAKKVFARLPSRSSSIGLSPKPDGQTEITAQEIEISWADLKYFMKDVDWYSDDPVAQLTWFLEDYKPDPKQCCNSWTAAKEIAQALEKSWPSDLAQEAAKRAVGHLDDMVFHDPDEISDRDLALLQVARLEKTTGCVINPATLDRVIKRSSNYEFKESITNVAIGLVKYLDQNTGSETMTSCVASEKLNSL